MLPEVRAAATCFYKVFGCSLFLKIKFSESVFPISGGDLKPKAPGLPPAGRFELALAQAAAFCWCPVGLLSHGHSPRGSGAHHTACCVTFQGAVEQRPEMSYRMGQSSAPQDEAGGFSWPPPPGPFVWLEILCSLCVGRTDIKGWAGQGRPRLCSATVRAAEVEDSTKSFLFQANCLSAPLAEED